MNLYVIRHAWAGHYGDPAWPNDAVRPLTAEGQKRFARVVERLVAGGMCPQVIATSPLVRCVQTAQIVAKGVGKAEIVELEELRPKGDILALLRWTEQQAKRHEEIAWVGHVPDVEHFTAALIGDRHGAIHFSKGAVAAIRFEGPVALGCGELRWLATAQSLGIEKQK